MSVIQAARALLPGGWAGNVRIVIETGRIVSIEAETAPDPLADGHAVLLPGMANLHSHAFQRGMVGLTERRGPSADSFWSWRDVMYRFALSMTPDQLEAVAGQLYVEMLEAGFCRVGEFHYLHHDLDGQPYADLGEMAGRIAAAADRTGIGLTLLPVFYAHGGFGGAAPGAAQRRFINDIDSYTALVERCRALVRPLPGAVVGVAPHSLRAVSPEELGGVLSLVGDGPIHIHVAEQIKEVEDCIAWSGARPVDWLLDHAELDGRWCLIHATHMSDDEVRRMAGSGAIAGLCPITEANLGDGTFKAGLFLDNGGRFGVGSDSNVLIGAADELRQLEYSQRLVHQARNVLAVAEGSTGRRLFDAAVAGGAMALRAGQCGLAVGAAADFVSLDPDQDTLVGRADDEILDGWVFGGGKAVDCVWVGGRKQISGGRHRDREPINRRFRAVMAELAGR